MLDTLVNHDKSQVVIYNEVYDYLKKEFPDRPIESIRNAIKSCITEYTQEVLAERKTWTNTKENYIDCLREIVKRIKKSAMQQLQFIEPERDIVQEREFRRV